MRGIVRLPLDSEIRQARAESGSFSRESLKSEGRKALQVGFACACLCGVTRFVQVPSIEHRVSVSNRFAQAFACMCPLLAACGVPHPFQLASTHCVLIAMCPELVNRHALVVRNSFDFDMRVSHIFIYKHYIRQLPR
jgi:hypothetical protein